MAITLKYERLQNQNLKNAHCCHISNTNKEKSTIFSQKLHLIHILTVSHKDTVMNVKFNGSLDFNYLVNKVSWQMRSELAANIVAISLRYMILHTMFLSVKTCASYSEAPYLWNFSFSDKFCRCALYAEAPCSPEIKVYFSSLRY